MLTLPARSGVLIGRHAERTQIDRLTAEAASGRGGVLVLSGQAGIGKSALLDYAAQLATGMRIVYASGSELEQDLPFSGLHQLCMPLLEHLSDLPARQREALQVAFGLAEGKPDLFQISLAALGLLTAASAQPLLCLIDDAQWLDDASLKVLLFLSRRLANDPIALLLTLRIPSSTDLLDDMPSQVIGGLNDADARELLTRRSPFPLDARVRDRLIAEASGSPLALLELPRAGGYVPPETPALTARIEHEYRARLAVMSAPARLLLITAAADPTGDPTLLWGAAAHLGLDLSACSLEASATGLIDLGHFIRFCHPLARSAVYWSASAAQRCRAHAALAAATDPALAPDRRAWHRAQASAGPDDEIAGELEECASRAQSRGGVVAAAAFLERSAALSLAPRGRIERTLSAAQAYLRAGMSAAAEHLLASLNLAVLSELQRARVELLQGQAAFTRLQDDTGPLLMARAASRLSLLDAARSRDCFLDVCEMSLVAGRRGGVLRTVLAQAQVSAPPSTSPDLLDALIALVTEGYPSATLLLRRSLHGGQEPLWVRRPALAVMIAIELWEPETHTTITQWLLQQGQASGSPQLVQLGLAQKAVDAALTGEIGEAIAACVEEAAVADAAGLTPLFYQRLHLAAQRGRREEFSELVQAAETAIGGEGQATNLDAAAATLYNGLADYPAALAAARRATEPEDLFTGLCLPELVEAAVHCRERDLAKQALRDLIKRTEAAPTSAGQGIAAYARAQVSGREDDFLEAIKLLGECQLMPYQGRAHLIYGEWLRREGRRREARRPLRTAHKLLTRSGSDGFVHRAEQALRAVGQPIGVRSDAPHEKLTSQEVAVARLVASGATSHQVARQLFISKRTVDAHLRSIFRKLGITSRSQLKGHPGLP